MPDRVATWIQALLIALILALTWVPQLTAPLLLDESGTAWTLSAGGSEVWARSFPNAQSVLYCHLLWALTALTGSTSEWLLRLPSLLASLGTLFGLYRLGEASFPVSARLLAPLLWLLFINPPGLEVHLWPPSLALQARPYALAMCVSVWAIVALQRYVATGLRKWPATFVVLTGILPWLSFFFFLTTGASAVLLIWLALFRPRIFPPRNAAACLGSWALMGLPLLSQLWLTAREAGMHAVRLDGQTRLNQNPAMIWTPPSIAFGVLAALAVMLISKPKSKEEEGNRGPDQITTLFALLISFAAVAPLFLAARLTGAHLAQTRYLCLAFAPLAFLYAALLARHAGVWAQTCAAIISTALVLAPEVFTRRSPEQDLVHSFPRVIAEIERERSASLGQARVYLTSGFVEAARAKFPEAESESRYLAPYVYYKLSGPYQLLPPALAQGSAEWAQALTAHLQAESQFIFAGSLPPWLRSAVSSSHTVRVVAQTPGFVIAVFRKRP